MAPKRRFWKTEQSFAYALSLLLLLLSIVLIYVFDTTFDRGLKVRLLFAEMVPTDDAPTDDAPTDDAPTDDVVDDDAWFVAQLLLGRTGRHGQRFVS